MRDKKKIVLKQNAAKVFALQIHFPCHLKCSHFYDTQANLSDNNFNQRKKMGTNEIVPYQLFVTLSLQIIFGAFETAIRFR